MARRTARTAVAIVGAAAVLLLAAGCTGPAVSAEGTWGSGADGKPQLVLESGGVLSGTDGCNRLAGSWTLEGDTIEFGEVASTLMACEGVDTWLSGLDTGVLDGSVLHILDADGAEIGTLART